MTDSLTWGAIPCSQFRSRPRSATAWVPRCRYSNSSKRRPSLSWLPSLSRLAPAKAPQFRRPRPQTRLSRGARRDVEDAVPAAEEEDSPGAVAKSGYRAFYDDVSRRLAATGAGQASFFLNYGYVSRGQGDQPAGGTGGGDQPNPSPRPGTGWSHPTAGQAGSRCGLRPGWSAALLAARLEARVLGIDLSPEAIAFCRQAHTHPYVSFKVGDAEHLPMRGQFLRRGNQSSSPRTPILTCAHFYARCSGFCGRAAGSCTAICFLAADGRKSRPSSQHSASSWRPTEISPPTSSVPCDEIASGRGAAFGAPSAAIDNFLAFVPGSPVYEQMRTGAWEYRLARWRVRSET